MKVTAIFSLILSLMILSGCNEGKQTKEEKEPAIDHIQNPHPGHVTWENDMQLDKGSPWEVNQETTAGIQKMTQLMDSFSTGTVEEYRQLGNRLEEESANVDTTRTRNEPSDKSMEVYMNALNEKIRQLQEVNSEEEGEKLKSEIEEQLDSYSDYFV